MSVPVVATPAASDHPSPEHVGDTEAASLNCATIALTALAAFSGLLFGYDTGVVSGAMLQMRYFDEVVTSDIQQSLAVSAAIGASFVGALLSGYLSDDLGRRPAILFSALLFLIGSMLMFFAPTFLVLAVGRMVVGAGIGIASSVTPVYIAETAPTNLRGALVTINTLFVTGGQLLSVRYAA
jgi:SP family myo-inositol transporter-like MFS transporter 13